MDGGDYMTLKESALAYANMGFAVFPLLPRDKRPATKTGCKAATTDKQQIESWWNSKPDCNIGIATGRTSGLVVIDLDVDEDKGINGYDTLREWQRDNGKLPDTWQSITGRGGYHLLYRDNTGNQNRVKLYDGVDIRGEGGYIVAPPSIHPNGKEYQWEYGPGDGEMAAIDSIVAKFLDGPEPEERNAQRFEMPERLPEGQRTEYLVKMVCSMQAKGASDEAIRAAVRAENDSKCIPSLSDEELEKEVFPALKRYEKGTAPYIANSNSGACAVLDNGRFRPVANKITDFSVKTLGDFKQKEPEWLISGWIPKYQITVMCGDGGSCKTSTWCHLTGAISSGNFTIFEKELARAGLSRPEPAKVMFFSSEDSVEYTLKGRLIKNKAIIENVITVDLKDDRFYEIKFNSELLENLIKEQKPALVIFDPLQSFVPPNIKMGQRNEMRFCLNPLIGIGEKYKTTFLIIMHTNKQSGMYGRKRMADSSDVWDIARSVIMLGETDQKGIRYITQEKSNYGPLQKTILFELVDGLLEFRGYSDKHDREFILEHDFNARVKPASDSAKDFILEYLEDGEKEAEDLKEAAKANGISEGTLNRVRKELKQSGAIGSYRKPNKGPWMWFKK